MKYQILFWFLSEAILFGGILLSLAVLYIVFRINKRCINRKNKAYNPTSLNSSGGTLEEPSFSFSVLVNDTKTWKIAKTITHCFIYLSLGMGIVLSIGLNRVHWVVGAFLITLLYAFIFANLLRKRLDKEVIEREELLSDDTEKIDFIEDEYKYSKRSAWGKRTDHYKRQLLIYIQSLKETILAKRIVFAIGVAVILVISFVVSASSDCMCIAANPVELSTKWSRNVQKSICDGRIVCHVYVTMADTSRDLIVNFHTTKQLTGLVAFDTISHVDSEGIEVYANATYATSFKMYNIVEEDRYVHWAELSGLEPGSTYYFYIEVSDDNGVVGATQEYKVRTIPESGDGAYNFISGGDMSADDNVVTLSKFAASKNPYFAMVGGDVAYDNGMINCYRRWDTWFENWKYMVTPDGFMIPALLAVGNHEAGGFKQYGGSTPFFTAYFPQQLGLQGVDPFQRTLYHVHRIGKKGFITVLDSDVLTTMEDQASFVDTAFAIANTEQRNAKFAIYHATIYATVPTFAKAVTAEGKQHWTPLFDKHNLTIVFENHLHCYKRTKPLRDDKITTVEQGGVVYLGDGSWGVDPRLIPATYSWYMEVVEKKQHVFSITVNATQVSTEAIGIDGKIFDSWGRIL